MKGVRSPVWWEKWYNTEFVEAPVGALSASINSKVKVARSVAPHSRKNPAQVTGGEPKKVEIDHWAGKHIFEGKKAGAE